METDRAARPETSEPPARRDSEDRGLLYVDMAYGLDDLVQRKHFQFFEARHSGGYFTRVVGVHPLADRIAALDAPIVRRRFSARQDVIEAKAFALGLPALLRPLDLLISQRRLFRRIVDIVRREKLGFVAATDPLYSGLFGYWVAKATKRPLIVHLVANYRDLHAATGSVAMPRLIPSFWLEKRVVRFVFERADLIAAGSERLGEYAAEMGARPDRISHFRVTKNVSAQHRTPPAERASPRAFLDQYDVPHDARLLLTVARLHPVKIVDHSIKALAKIVAAHPDCVLLLAGDGPERERLEALVAELGLGPNVRFLGSVDQDLLALIIPHTIVLSPITGIALYETALGGAPTVAYNFDPQIAELVEDEVTGYLIPDGDIDAMAAAAIRLLDHPHDARRMGDAIRARALALTDPVAVEAVEHRAFDALARRSAQD